MPIKKTTKKKEKTKIKHAVKKKITRVKKTTVKKTLVVAPPEKCFWVNNGLIVKDLKELEQALQSGITDEQFKTHIDNGNDFARWIDEVLGDSSCAKALARMKSRKSARTVISKHLKKYQ